MLDHKVLEAAATWYVQLNATVPNQADLSGWERWMAQDARHAQAWARVQKLQQQLGVLPCDVALPTLAGARARRRAVVKVLGLLLVTSATGLSLHASEPWPARLAQMRTGKGERRLVQLADGGRMTLNTDSAVDVSYTERLREVHLYHGEILIETAHDPAGRAFIVHTAQGSIRALGTRFVVRGDADSCQVRVLEHAVELRPALAPQQMLRLGAGQQADFDRQQLGQPHPLGPDSDAWVHGMLSVPDWPLHALVSELQRYRPGILSCSEAVANLRVTGGFRLDDTDIILQNLASSLPIRVRYLTRYWVRIEAA